MGKDNELKSAAKDGDAAAGCEIEADLLEVGHAVLEVVVGLEVKTRSTEPSLRLGSS